jgi:hypothetical protein
MNYFFPIALVGFTGILLTAHQAIAQADNLDQFIYGCGTGCRVTVERIGTVRGMTYDGYAIQSSAFYRQITGGGRGNSNIQEVVYYFASCSTKELAFSPVDTMPTAPSAWVQITGTSQDYTTVAGGLGYYFDALCQDVLPSTF